VEQLLQAAIPELSAAEVAWLEGAARSDEVAWRREFGLTKDVSKLGVERNLFRYLPVPVTIRVDGGTGGGAGPWAAEGTGGGAGRRAAESTGGGAGPRAAEGTGPVGTTRRDLLRLVLAAARVGAPITVSTTAHLPGRVVENFHVEDHDAWLDRLDRTRPERVRLVGSSLRDAARVVEGDPDVAFHADPVTPSGRIEALPFLREQSISVTHHRFGNPVPTLAGLLPRGPR
jgi:RHH-type proline utilization regulon transcriptional repressor/proline dehydrogenase/delta 1-pyrroline-5-carboxylate dehydrogenase